MTTGSPLKPGSSRRDPGIAGQHSTSRAFPGRGKRAESIALGLRSILWAAAAWQALRAAARLHREIRNYRAADARLGADWTFIRAAANRERLAVHARICDDAPLDLPPIILVHGYGIGSSYFVPVAARLADRAHVYAPDLPGHGPSDRPAQPLTIAELVEALASWMETRGLYGALLVGHSAGCQVATEAALRRSELVSALALVGPTTDPAIRHPLALVARALRTSRFDSPSAAIWTLRDYRRAGVRLLFSELREMMAHHIEERLPSVRVPVRVVRGGRDEIAPQHWVETVARLAGAPSPTVIAGRGHAVHYDAPDEVARVVLEFARNIGR